MRVRSVAMKAELPELLLDKMQIFTMTGSSTNLPRLSLWQVYLLLIGRTG
jgi:hypothetical protein